MAKKFLTLNIGAATVELAEYEAGAKGALTLVNYGTAALSAPLDGGNAETILSPALLEIVREKGIKNDDRFWDNQSVMNAQQGGKPMVERRQGLVDRSKTIWAMVNPNDYEATMQ